MKTPKTRVHFDTIVEVLEHGNWSAVQHSTNFSDRGLFIETIAPLPVESKISVRIKFQGDPIYIELSGVVRWARHRPDDEGRRAGMGIEFTGTEEQFASLERKVANYSRHRKTTT
ncbi:MAG: hypothetical protein EOP04_03860 [Proteobacteria bacterium]|nr:MAG: hypothetical protein EOP04_03860 [Pseudomonadota bacterium]